jgi:hypothetical protein
MSRNKSIPDSLLVKIKRDIKEMGYDINLLRIVPHQ